MLVRIPVDEHVADPARAGFADEAAEGERDAEEEAVLGSVELVQLLGDAGGRKDEDDAAVGVGPRIVSMGGRSWAAVGLDSRGVVDARDDDRPVLHHLEVVAPV